MLDSRRKGAHPLQAFPIDNITTQEAESCRLSGVKLLIDLGQLQPVHHGLTPTGTGLVLSSLRSAHRCCQRGRNNRDKQAVKKEKEKCAFVGETETRYEKEYMNLNDWLDKLALI